MITIGICDDDPQFVDYLYHILHEIMMPISDWKSRIYNSGSEVLAAISNEDFDCDLLFTDIFMENGTGLELAKYIFEHGIDTDLIFISNSKEYVFECYQYHTFAYLLKPLSKADVGAEIRRYMEEMSSNSKCLNISIRGINHRIPLNTIIYIESNRRKVTIHTKSNDYDYYEKLDVLEELLKGDGFIRCHQSYLIPIDRITSFHTTGLTLDGISRPISVSRRYQNDIKQLFDSSMENSYLSEVSATKEPDCYLTSSLNCNQTNTGAFICVEGAYVGAIIRIKPEQRIIIGRDGEVADFIVNLPLVSRVHCEVIYHEENHEYEIIDFSSNGTFVNGNKRLIQNESYLLKPGTELCFGDKTTIYKLG